MATLTYYLKKRQGKHKHSLYLRVTHNRISKFINTDLKLSESNWNKSGEKIRKSHPEFKKLNNYLTRKRLKAEVTLLNLNEINGRLTSEKIKKAIENDAFQKGKNKNDETIDFFEYAEDIIKDYKARVSFSRWKSFKTVLNKVKEFWNKKALAFEEIDVRFLRKYEVYCIQERGNKPNTVKSNLKKVRTIFNDAIKDGAISHDLYPFRDYNMPSNTVIKTKLSEIEIDKIRALKFKKGTRLFDSQKIFLFAYYCRGMRFRDACQLRWGNINAPELSYKMSKTGKQLNFSMPNYALKILEVYKTQKCPPPAVFVFPFLDRRKDYSNKEFLNKKLASKNALVNKYLKKIQQKAEIDDHISFHVARHSFAQRALENNVSLIDIRDLLGHKKISTTMKYLRSLGQQHLDKTANNLFN